MTWREQSNDFSDSYFRAVNLTGFNWNNRHTHTYTLIEIARRPVAYSEEIQVNVNAALRDISYDKRSNGMRHRWWGSWRWCLFDRWREQSNSASSARITERSGRCFTNVKENNRIVLQMWPNKYFNIKYNIQRNAIFKGSNFKYAILDTFNIISIVFFFSQSERQHSENFKSQILDHYVRALMSRCNNLAPPDWLVGSDPKHCIA